MKKQKGSDDKGDVCLLWYTGDNRSRMVHEAWMHRSMLRSIDRSAVGGRPSKWTNLTDVSVIFGLTGDSLETPLGLS